jgi:general secretion pathway protein G
MRKAFTMTELIFVIVILGILAAVAVPKMGSSKSHAEISKARADVASIRSAILTERQSQIIKGNNNFIDKLSDNDSVLFKGNGTRTLLTYGVAAGTSSGKWSKNSDGNYTFHINEEDITFLYKKEDGTFSCKRDNDTCKKIVD